MESYRLGVPVVFEFELKNKKKRKRSVQLDVNWGDPEDVVRNFGEISRLNKKRRLCGFQRVSIILEGQNLYICAKTLRRENSWKSQ